LEPRVRVELKIRQLLKKGADIPNPLSLDIGDEVNIDQISSEGVKIYPGCRIYGDKTVISAGCRLGYEAPATIDNCQMGAKVELRGGFFSNAVFLEKANLGLGAQVREGCILEEEANGAHCVGLKQTILFPFVTLGSLINFCDCLMAGGTSRKNHSEVGSSYIHFNFTPDADKTTPSLLGDVPRGVMLNQPPIFLGGQGGIVGPVRLGYGNVVAAGSILRRDYPRDNQLIVAPMPAGSARNFTPAAYPNIGRIIENNILYLANLKALETWYRQVRKAFFEAAEFGPLLYDGVLSQLALAREERLKRLGAMAQRAALAASTKPNSAAARTAFYENIPSIASLFKADICKDETKRLGDGFLEDFHQVAGRDRTNYIETIRNLPPEVAARGVLWLKSLVDEYCARVATLTPSLGIFK